MAKNKTTPPSSQMSLPVSHEMLRLIAEIDEFKSLTSALGHAKKAVCLFLAGCF
jgi:hypothetical protein